MVRLLGGLAITVMTRYAARRRRSGMGRGVAGTGLDLELAADRIRDGCSPNVPAEVGRLVGPRPIAAARAALARRGLNLDEKAVRRIASEWGAPMLAVRTRALLRFRTGGLPAGTEFAGKRVAVPIDGGRVRVRTIVQKSRGGGQRKRRKFRIAWREPKVVIVYELDEHGRRARGSRPVIDGTLQGPGALIEWVAFPRHRLGAAQAREVVFVADGAPWIWARLDWVVAQVGLNPLRVVEVLDWCHGVPHVSVALEALTFDKATRWEHDQGLRTLLKKGKSKALLQELEALGEGSPADAAVLARDPLPEKARRGATPARRCLPVLASADGERCDREHDPPRDQPPAQGEQPGLDGGERGSGVPTSGGGGVGSLGRDR